MVCSATKFVVIFSGSTESEYNIFIFYFFCEIVSFDFAVFKTFSCFIEIMENGSVDV